MTRDETGWLEVVRGEAPLLVSVPHAGTEIPRAVAERLASERLARKDTDWYVDRLYGFASELGATVVRTAISRTVIDVNRDPSGASLYPGLATTELCPNTTFEGEPLYRVGEEPDASEIAARRAQYFDPYHAALAAQIDRLRARYAAVVVFDAHSIRPRVPRLFDGELPVFNLGTNSGRSCAPELTRLLERVCDATGLTRVTDGRFKGGYITRRCGDPARNVHAVQVELSMKFYLDEPAPPPGNTSWPWPWDGERAAVARVTLRKVLAACIDFARERG
jgi:formiminoglutamase